MITATISHHDRLTLLRTLADELPTGDLLSTRVWDERRPYLEVEVSWVQRDDGGSWPVREPVVIHPLTVTVEGFGSMFKVESDCRLVDSGRLTFEEIVGVFGDLIDRSNGEYV